MSLESVFRLSLIMNMIDNLTGPMAGVTSSVNGTVSKLQKANAALGNMAKTGAVMQEVGSQITGAVLSPVEATFETRRAIGELASLGVKDHSVDPWQVFMDTYAVGDVANVKVVKLMTFGAFAEIVPGVDGLIHISQIADHRIEKPGDVLAEGDMVDVKITDIDMEHKKVSLSIRALLEEPAAAEDEEEA